MTTWRRQHVLTLQYLATGTCLGVLVSLLLTGTPPGTRNEETQALQSAFRVARRDFLQLHGYDRDDSRKADELRETVSVLCYVVLPAAHVPAKRRVYQQTWGRRCDRLLLFSNQAADNENIVLDIGHPSHIEEDARASMEALRYLYEHHSAHAQWFLRVHPMTYVVLENLRYFLRDEDSNQAVYFGQKIRAERTLVPFGFGGYVLSRRALQVFGDNESTRWRCSQGTLSEYEVLGNCFNSLGIKFGDSRDAEGRSRFHGIAVGAIAVHDYQSWFHDIDPYDSLTRQGVDSVSNYAITFSPISDAVILAMEYYTHTARVYGRLQTHADINRGVRG